MEGIKPNIKKGAETEEAEMVFEFVDDLDAWKKDWLGMPEFIQEDLAPWKQVIVSFENREDMEAFGKLIGQKVQFTTRSIWFPAAEIGRIANKRYSDG